MIQRIQTVYLLLAIVCLSVGLYFPAIQLESPNYHETFMGWNVYGPLFGYKVWLNAILVGTAIGFSLIAMLVFNWRPVQKLLCVFAGICIAAASGFVFYRYQTRVFVGDVIFTAWNICSLLAVVFVALAFFAIKKDEQLLESLDRLR